jgi:hypothetical protein
MRAWKSFRIAVISLVFGFIAAISLAQQVPKDLPDVGVELGAGAKLVVTAVSGPVTAHHNKNITVTYSVQNKGDAASGPYQVGLYLSADRTVDLAVDRLLEKVMFTTGLAPGETRPTTTKVLIPNSGLSGTYYYGAVVESSSRASINQVWLDRFTVGRNVTVTDHKTGLIWQRTDEGVWKNWADAGHYCENLALGGKTDWRLPRIDELETIVDYLRRVPAIDSLFGCQSNIYWSGSAYVDHPDSAWSVDFATGDSDWHSKTYDYYLVRCVRGGLR